MGVEIRTWRSRRTWLEKLRMWPRAYETKVFAGYRQAVSRGRTPEAAQDAALATLRIDQASCSLISRSWLTASERLIAFLNAEARVITLRLHLLTKRKAHDAPLKAVQVTRQGGSDLGTDGAFER